MKKYAGRAIAICKDTQHERPIILTCLEYKDAGHFIAHCLEFDLVAQGGSLGEARENLADLISSQVTFASEKGLLPKSLFHPAPARYWQIYFEHRAKLARQYILKRKSISPRVILDKMSCAYAHV